MTRTRKLASIMSAVAQVRPHVSVGLPSVKVVVHVLEQGGRLGRRPRGPSVPRHLHAHLRRARRALDPGVEADLDPPDADAGREGQAVVVEAVLVFGTARAGRARARAAVPVHGPKRVVRVCVLRRRLEAVAVTAAVGGVRGGTAKRSRRRRSHVITDDRDRAAAGRSDDVRPAGPRETNTASFASTAVSLIGATVIVAETAAAGIVTLPVRGV